MEEVTQPVNLSPSSLMQPLSDLTGFSPQTCYVFLSLGVIGLVVAALLLGRRDKGLNLEDETAYSKLPRDKVVIVGPVGSGKTQLFYKLLS